MRSCHFTSFLVFFLFLHATAQQSWQYVGPPNFSAGASNYSTLRFSSTGIPFVAFQDAANPNNSITVMKYVGNNWVNVGSPGFPSGSAFFISLRSEEHTSELQS